MANLVLISGDKSAVDFASRLGRELAGESVSIVSHDFTTNDLTNDEAHVLILNAVACQSVSELCQQRVGTVLLLTGDVESPARDLNDIAALVLRVESGTAADDHGRPLTPEQAADRLRPKLTDLC